MTVPYQRETPETVLGNVYKRVKILEAVKPTPDRGVTRGSNKYDVHGPEWQMNFVQNLWTATATVDAASPWNGYADLGNSDGNYVGFGCPLGPSETFWRVGIWFYQDTDYGRLKLQLGTTRVDEFAATSGSYGTAYSIQDPFTPSVITWYDFDVADPTNQLDGYSVTPGWTFNFFQPFWIMGPDGQQLATNGVTTPAGPRKAFADQSDFAAGGDDSVYWWPRLIVNGKNASSTGFKARVSGMTVARITGSGYSVA